jgi:hypothetical protein
MPEDSRPRADAERRGLFTLLRALAESGIDLAHNTARMAASEARIILRRLVVRTGLFIGGLMLAAVGLLISLLGAALILAEVTGWPPWLAHVIVGVVVCFAGAILAARGLGSLGDPDLGFPATLAEFELDVQTLRSRTGSLEEVSSKENP